MRLQYLHLVTLHDNGRFGTYMFFLISISIVKCATCWPRTHHMGRVFIFVSLSTTVFNYFPWNSCIFLVKYIHAIVCNCWKQLDLVKSWIVWQLKIINVVQWIWWCILHTHAVATKTVPRPAPPLTHILVLLSIHGWAPIAKVPGPLSLSLVGAIKS
jgi:hypothetical protein